MGLTARIDEAARDPCVGERVWWHADLAVREAIEAQDSERDKQRIRDHYEQQRQATKGPDDQIEAVLGSRR